MNKFTIISGPCLAESYDLLATTVRHLKEIIDTDQCDFIFKASYKKANRTSLGSFTGIGDVTALEFLKEINNEFSVPVITDVHTPQEVELAAKYVNYLQIPAFLSRQTELLTSAGATGLPINIKKAQFMAPDDMKKALDKVLSTGNNKVFLTERGTFFGYHDLVVDFRSMLEMKKFGVPVIYDATHSLQKPSIGEQSGGLREFTFQMARAAVSLGIDGVFFETHPNPEHALSDAATQLPLDQSERFISQLISVNNLILSM